MLRYGRREGGYLRSSPCPRISRRPCSLPNVQQIPSHGRQGASSIIRRGAMPGAHWNLLAVSAGKTKGPGRTGACAGPQPSEAGTKKAAEEFLRHFVQNSRAKRLALCEATTCSNAPTKPRLAPIGFGRKAITHRPSRARR